MSRTQNKFMRRAWSRMMARMRHSRRVLPQPPRGLRLRFESLEDRAVPASVVFAESTFDPEEYGRNISAEMDFNFVGYAYAINYNGNVAVTTGTGGLNGPNAGLARTSQDLPITAFAADTRIEQNSVSKIITAVTVLHLLESQYDDLVAALNLPISEFLPSDWTYGLYVDSLTVRHLLTHTTGFYEGGSEDTPNAIGVNFESFGNNNFQNLRTLVATSPGIPTITLPDGSVGYPRGYSNANFSLLARMIPYMLPENRAHLDDISANDPGSADAEFGVLYRDYVRDHILIPSGIVNPSMDVSGDNPAMGYDFATAESEGGTSQSDHTDTGGAFGWNLSAPEMAHFLHALSHTETLLSDEARAVMNSDTSLLGWSPGTFSGDPYIIAPLRDEFGLYFGHGGAGLGFRSEIAVLPGGIEAALAMNSGANDALLVEDPDHLALDRSRLLRTAYRNSWSHLVIAADTLDESFVVRRRFDDVPRLDIIVIANGDERVIASPAIDFLTSLTLRGHGSSNDLVFEIEELPASLNLVLEGGQFVNTYKIGTIFRPAFVDGIGSLSILGNGPDQLIINDAGGSGESYSIRGIDNPEIPFEGIITGPNGVPGNLFLFRGVSRLELIANSDPNQIEIEGIPGGMTLDVFAWTGDDTIRVSNLAEGVTVNLTGGGGSDQFEVWDIPHNSSVRITGGDPSFSSPSNDLLILGQGDLGTVQGPITFDGMGGDDAMILDDRNAAAGRSYEVGVDTITGSGLDVAFDSVEFIRYDGSSHNDFVNVDGVHERTELELFGNDGDDTFSIARDLQNVDDVAGLVVIHGGEGIPRGTNPNPIISEDDDRLYVRDDNNTEPGEYLVDRDGSKYHGRVLKYGETRSDLGLRVMYDQIERTVLHADDGDDTITVSAAPLFNRVWVYAGGGNDLIDVESSPAFTAAMQILAEDGKDTIRISPLAHDLGNLRSPVAIDGGLDQDILLVSDVSSPVGRVYGLGDADLSRNGSAGLTYKALEELTIELTAADDSLSVTGLANGVAASVFALGGNDTFAAGNGDFNANIRGDLLLHGGFGIDSLLIDDRSGAAGTHTIDTDTYSKTPGTGTLAFSFMQDVRLETGNGSDTVDVNDTAAGFDLSIDTRAGNDAVRVHATAPATTLTIITRGGDDTIEVAPDGRDLDAIGGDIVLEAGKGNDNVIINDQNDLGDDAYTVTTAEVTKVNFLLNYDAVETLTLNANEGKNTIDVEGTLSSTALTVYAGGGNDHIHLNPATNRLNQIRGTVWVYGQAGFDTVHAHDELNVLNTTYILTRNRLSRPGFGGVNFETIDRLRLNMGSGNDTIHVQEFHRDVQFVLNGNNGADTFNVTVHPTELVTGGSLVVNGGGNPAIAGSGDRLNVVFDSLPIVPKEPDIQFTPNNPIPGSGTILFDYADLDAMFDIQYTGIEVVKLNKA